MSVEGIWTSEVMGLFGWETTGILVLENGRAIDGGNHHYSVGSYTTSGDNMNIELAVEYHGTPRTIFGSSDKNLTVEIEGKIQGSTVEGNARRIDKPDQYVLCRLTRRADIPKP
ncbi:MAG: hypothetical protein OEU36_22005 [Gammaproteobacteria bacterium]|nr:hypothetical protein [Gammaproteobacteria bacterium]